MKRYDMCDSTCTTDCGHCKGRGIPESFWTDDAPIGEVQPGVVPMSKWDVVDRVTPIILRIQHEAAVVEAAVELEAAAAAEVEFGSDVWFDKQARLFDAVQILKGTALAPSPLVANRTAETSRLNMTGLARGILSDGGAK